MNVYNGSLPRRCSSTRSLIDRRTISPTYKVTYEKHKTFTVLINEMGSYCSGIMPADVKRIGYVYDLSEVVDQEVANLTEREEGM